MSAPLNSESVNSESDASGSREPSLGPACMVVSILGLAAFSALCGLGSWLVFSNQYPIAVKSIEKQLIPWVEGSQLAPDDKASIVSQLESLIGRLESQSIDKSQLVRLRNCLQDNPVLLWGGIQSIEQQAAGAGLTETEVESLIRLNQRFLRMATERKMGRRDLEFTLQELSSVRSDRSTLVVRGDLTAEQIRSFMTRAESLVARANIPNEPYEKTPAEAFALLLDAALNSSSDS
jgi:hypothetical protein